MKEYHYTECGLDNVYLYNIPVVTDVKGEDVVCIKKINKLHKVIAEAIINKKGMINPKEIRFLRTLLAMTQGDFSNVLGKEAQAVGRWERGEINHDNTTDLLIRAVVRATLGLPPADASLIAGLPVQKEEEKIDINGENEEYTLFEKCA